MRKVILNNDQPYLFNLKRSQDFYLFKKLKEERNITILDLYKSQSKDIANVPLLNKKFDKSNSVQWIFFPWKKVLVKCLKKKYFQQIKSSRNLYILNQNEQKMLSRLKIGIAGLSVGSSIAANLVLEGCGGLLKIADKDEINISNLNRLRTSVLNIGKTKESVLREELFEINPFIKIQSFKNGITKKNVKSFLDNPKLDLVIEETDDLEIKVVLRKAAKEKKIPLVMATAIDTKLIIDFEDYRLNNTAVFNGIISSKEVNELSSSDIRRKASGAVKILGLKYFSTRVRYTFKELNKSVNAFPQLASGAILRASVVSFLIRMLFIENIKLASGRYVFDLKDVFRKKYSA